MTECKTHPPATDADPWGATPAYHPPPRCGTCGHRIPRRPGWRPIRTLRMGAWYMLAEIANRHIARERRPDEEPGPPP
jgi:hypothetical protein